MAWTREAALAALESNDLLQLGMDADAMRRTLHGDEIATYAVLPHIPFPRTPHLQTEPLSQTEALIGNAEAVLQPDATDLFLDATYTDRTHTLDAVTPDRATADRAAADRAAADRAIANPELMEATVKAFTALRSRFPRLRLHGLSAADVLQLSRASGQSEADTLQRLERAGLATLDGAGAGMLRDLANDWIRIHRAAHTLGLPTVAELVIGQGEELADRVSHLEALRALQRETGGFVALMVSVHHGVSAEARREEEATATDYLKTLAVARLFVEEIEHVQGDWRVQGPKVLGLALRFGADDAGSVEPRQTAGREPRHHGGETELRRIIRDAGFRPVERDALFRQSILH
jgi:cyclic dehypoxanthinyl futalosine synthase